MAATFHLTIASMDGSILDGEAQRITLRSIDGDVAILAHHTNYCTAIGMGEARVILEDGTERSAACIGGMLTVLDNSCRVIPTTWEWRENIDVSRARKAKDEAEKALAAENLGKAERARLEARRDRAIVRLAVAADDRS